MRFKDMDAIRRKLLSEYFAFDEDEIDDFYLLSKQDFLSKWGDEITEEEYDVVDNTCTHLWRRLNHRKELV